MRKLRAMWMRLVGLMRPGQDDEEFSAELEAHLALHIEAGMRAGLSEAEARRQALIRLGGVEQTRQAYRERSGMPWLESLLRDLRYSLRALAKHKGVTAVAILSIGLGIGANATIFSMVNRFVLRPAPVGDPATLLALHLRQDGEHCCNNFPKPMYDDVRNEAKSFSGLSGYYELIPASIGGNGDPERVWGQGVTTNFFDVLELPMVLGRGFVSSDERLAVVVLSARLWQRRFHGDAAIVGKTVTLSGRLFTVVGIAPAAFHSVDQILDAEFWVPLDVAVQLVPNLPPQDSREFHWIAVFARLRAGVTRAQAAAELNTLAGRFAASYPKTDKGYVVRVRAGRHAAAARTGRSADLSQRALAGGGAAARDCGSQRGQPPVCASGRQAGRNGGAAGAGCNPGQAAGPDLDGERIARAWGRSAGRSPFAVGHAVAVIDASAGAGSSQRARECRLAGGSVHCSDQRGVGPAAGDWSRVGGIASSLANALKGEDAFARAGRRWNLRNVLVVAQIAMSLTTLSVTGLFLRSLESAANIDIGFRSQGLLMLSVDPRLNGYTPERTSRFLAELRQRAAALPGVDAAVCTDVALLSGGNRSDGFTVTGPRGKTRRSPMPTCTW